MTLHINGEAREMPLRLTIAEVVEDLRLPAATLLIEHNGIALRRAEWEATGVVEGDRLECLQIAAGG